MESELYDKNTEMAFIGCLIIDNSLIYKLFDVLEPDDFYLKYCKLLYVAIMEQFATGVHSDIITITTYEGIRELEGISYFCTQCIDMVSAPSAAIRYAKIVKDFSKKRKFNRLLKMKALQITSKPIDDLLEATQQGILDIGSGHVVDSINFLFEWQRLIDRVRKIIAGEKPDQNTDWTLKYSIEKLNIVTGGIAPGDFIVLGGLKKSGKSKFLIQELANVCVTQNSKALFFSMEMPSEKVVRWLASHLADVDSLTMKTPKSLTPKDLKAIAEFEKERIPERIAENLELDVRPYLTDTQIKAKMSQSKQHLGTRVVFIDYLQRAKMVPRKGENEAKTIERFCTSLADHAKKMEMAVYILSQLQNIAEGQHATLQHLKGSGGIGEAATVIGILNNLDRIKGNTGSADKPRLNKSTLTIEQRDGRGTIVEMNHCLATGRFWDEDYIPPDPGYNDNGGPAPF